jgi:hypothetical protein
MSFKKTNNITGWVVCIIACIVYIMTREATASFWDCGEFISAAYKLQIPHAPGAPLVLLLDRLFIILFGGGPHTAALKVNLLSALASGFTILFLFWTITHFARKLMVKKDEKISLEKLVIIMAAGAVGALAYTFSDSFWFSAVEGEVYALSSFFTAIIFWAMLKWEDQAEEPHADRWIVFIAFMIGLAIGVHLLCILTIPAVVMIYYFKRYKVTAWGTFWAFVIGCIITGAVQKVVIQYTVQVAGYFDVFFVNTLHLPFNSGSYFFLIVLAVLIIIGLRISHRRTRYFLHLGLLCLLFMLVGYSTYFTTLIRANARPAINMQNVDDPMALVNYLDRSQYGDWPILYGQDFTARPERYDQGAAIYERNDTLGKYVVSGHKQIPVYNPSDEHPFPRIWDNTNDRGQSNFYREWLGLSENENPTLADNVKWLFSYQIGWMYMRYFLWNFAGRQNDIQGFGDVRDGNWITGIPFLDNLRLGDQSKMPESLKKNKAHNRLYGLPLLLGLFGLFFQLNRNRKDFLVNLLLFIFTGLAIVFYLNQSGPQPRERDYAFVGSFYAFAVWIGLGVLSVFTFLRKRVSAKVSVVAASLICLVLVPVLMGFTEWDDHDRSQKTLARDVAGDYLESCKPNAILFTEGDNDTYPLWYAQEVEGIRTDVRIINMSLLGVDWYIDDLRYKINKAAPVPMTWSPDKYAGETRNYIPYVPPKSAASDKQYYSLEDLMTFMGSDNRDYMVTNNGTDYLNYYPTQQMYIPVNKQHAIQYIPARDTAAIVGEVTFHMPKSVLYKNDLMLLDIIAADKWERPIYFTSPVTATRMGLGDYLETDGLTYRLVPVRSQESNNSILEAGNVNTAFMYQNLMNKFRFGGAQTAGTYFDEPNRRMLLGIRNSFAKLGMALALEGKKDSAVRVLNKCDSNMLQQNFPYALTSPGNMHNINSLQTVYAYYLAGDSTKGDEIAEELINDCQQQLVYYNALSSSEFGPTLQQDARTANMIISQLQQWMSLYGKKAKGTHSEELPIHMDSLKQPSKQDHPVKTGGQGK